jgi:outer membrane protein assembly factor BamB
MRAVALVLLVACALSPALAHAATIEGTVFFDRDGDGLFSAADEPLAATRIAWGSTVFATSGLDGTYSLTVPDGTTGIVWVSVPEGGVPGPRWNHVTANGVVTLDLAIEPLDVVVAGAPLTFVVASDAHLDGVVNTNMIADLEAAVGQALAVETPPRFFTVVGDITQANRPQDFDGVDAVLGGFDVPWVPVPGNHDWYDGGAAYRARWGPDMYSFTTGGVHFVVWNSEISVDAAVEFLMDDLAGVDASIPVIALGHKPPRDEVSAVMNAAGVDYIFTGHWHSNRSIDHDGMIELTTQPLLFGGVDLTPAGYRVVRLVDGALEVDLHNFIDEPVVEIVWPRDDRCAGAGAEVLVAVETGTDLRTVEAVLDGVALELERAGGWLWKGRLPDATGAHALEVLVGRAGDQVVRDEVEFETCSADATRVLALADWPQQQGGPEHAGAIATVLRLPMEHAWIATVDRHLHQAAPIVADGRVFMTFGDFVANGGGGVIALDATDGSELWRALPGRVRNSAATSQGVVVVGTDDGIVHAFTAAAGAPLWSVDLGDGIDATQSTLWAAPTIRDGVVYAGVQRRIAAIGLEDGRVLWTADPDPAGVWLGSYGAVAVTTDLVIGTFTRTSGMVAWDREDGTERWRVVNASTKAVHGAPVVWGDHLYIANASGEVSSFEVATGERAWNTAVVESDDWDYAISSNLAVSEGRVFVATQWGPFVAVDAATGAILWTYEARSGPLRSANFRGPRSGFQASPVVAGDVVWIADASGLLVALDTVTGEERWQLDLGVPALSGLAVAGELLLVPTWDGAVHALVPAVERDVDEVVVVGVPAGEGTGCCASRGGRPPDVAVIVACVLVLARRGRRRRQR